MDAVVHAIALSVVLPRCLCLRLQPLEPEHGASSLDFDLSPGGTNRRGAKFALSQFAVRILSDISCSKSISFSELRHSDC
jgi:hypothetical protein